jgi:hypothetical protein
VADGGDTLDSLRNWRSVHLARLHLLMLKAADEIERLRITRAERDAIEWAITKTARTYDDPEGGPMNREALRGLLKRTK